MAKPKVHLGPPFEHGAKTNGWLPADATEFPVRGSNYLKDKKKIASRPSAFRIIGAYGFTAAEKIVSVTDSPFLAPVERSIGKDGKPSFLFVMHFDISPQHLVLAFELDEAQLEEDPGFANVWRRFLQGDDKYKAERIKLITSMVEASWVVRRAVGKPVPALIGNKLTCIWRQTADTLECTCDVSASMFARVILGVVRGACRDIVCDLMLLIEGRQEDELPERIIGGARVFRMDMATFAPVDAKRARDVHHLTYAQMPTRGWHAQRFRTVACFRASEEEVSAESVEEMLKQRDPEEVYQEGDSDHKASPQK